MDATDDEYRVSCHNNLKACRPRMSQNWTVLSHPPEMQMLGSVGWNWTANARNRWPSILSVQSLYTSRYTSISSSFSTHSVNIY